MNAGMKPRMDVEVPPWLGGFRESHERFVRGELAASGRELYRRQRETFSQWFTGLQALTGPEEARARRSFRVVHGLPVVLGEGPGACESITADVSTGGFACLVYEAPEVGAELETRLDLLDGKPPIAVRAAVVAVIHRGGSVRAAFRLARIEQEDAERLETVLVSLAIRHLFE
jgi:hypothetical protein